MNDQTVLETEIRDWIGEQLAMLLGRELSEMDPDSKLEEMDVISLDVVHVIAAAMKQFGIKVPRAEFEGHDTINKLAGLMARHAG